jgi:hypothetical protein
VLVTGRRLSTIDESIEDAQRLQEKVRIRLLDFFKGEEEITVV